MRVSRGPLSRGILIATLLATTLSGCAATQTGNMWRDSTFEAQGFKNMLVIAMRNDATKRRMWEDNLALGLAPYGIKVQMSYRLWPTSLPDTAAVIEAVKRDGFDGVLVSHHENIKTEEWVPGYTKREAVTTQSWSGAYYTYWTDVEVPDRMEATTVRNYKTNVWTTIEPARMIWSGTVQTTDAITDNVIRQIVEKNILGEMEKAKLITKPKK